MKKYRIKCKLCKSNNTNLLFKTRKTYRSTINEEKILHLYKCDDCGFVFIKKIKVDSEFISKNYLEDYYTQEENSRFLNLFYNLSSRLRLFIISKLLGKKAFNLLDVGCGDGRFIERLKGINNNIDTLGIDINEHAINFCKKKNLKVIKGDVFNKKLNQNSFDVITLWHVFEHLENPEKFLKRCNNLLKPGGILMFSLPTSDSFGFKIAKNNWYHLDVPRHQSFFNKSSLKYLFKKLGYKKYYFINEFYEFPLDLFWSFYKNKNYITLSLFPILKIINGETLTVIIKNEKI